MVNLAEIRKNNWHRGAPRQLRCPTYARALSRWTIRVLVAAIILGGHTSTAAQAPDYLVEMPAASTVVEDMRGRTDRESAARASLALYLLAAVIRSPLDLSAAKRPLHPLEKARLAEYRSASAAIRAAETDKADPGCEGDDCAKYLLPRCEQGYVMSAAFYRELLDRYFSRRWIARNGGRFEGPHGALWQQALRLPSGTRAIATLPQTAMEACTASASPVSAWSLSGLSRQLGPVANSVGGGAWALVSALLLPVAIIAWLGRKLWKLRFFAVRRSNKAALAAFGSDPATREHAIIEAFDEADHTFRYDGVNRTSGHQMRFTLLRNTKSFRRADFEALRLAYLAFNRKLIDNETFHWYRFSAIYGGGITDPSEWRFGGLFGWLRPRRGAIDQARASLADYARGNAGADIESQALAAVQKLCMEHPRDSLYSDMRRRFVDGTYWLTRGEIKRSAFARSDSPFGLSFGTLDGSDAELVYSGEGSLVTVAPPRSGKTQCNVIPTLLRWRGAAFVLDLKGGDIYEATSKWRAENVGPVIRFAPLDPAHSAAFNPLSQVRRDPLYVWEDARLVADMLIVPVSKERIWDEKARDIVTAFIADVAYWSTPENRPMSKVTSLVNRVGWSDFITRMRTHPEVQAMREEGTSLANMEPKTLDGALQTAKASLNAWVGERITRATTRSDWNPRDLASRDRPPTIYVCIEASAIEGYLSLLRVVIGQHIRALTAGRVPPRDAPPILFMLDELPRLKQMPPIEEALEVGSEYKIKLWMFAQSLGQLRGAYPNADGMLGSCAVRSFMNAPLQDGTAQMLAEQIGYRRGEEHGGKDKATAGRPEYVVEPTVLAGPDYRDLQIVLAHGSKPARVRKHFAFQDPELRSRFGAVADDRAANRQ